jgi:hypothetical protein
MLVRFLAAWNREAAEDIASSIEARDTLLDDQTGERLLRGELSVGDAPPLYRAVTHALALVAAPATAAELSGEERAVAAIVARLQFEESAEPAAAPRPTRSRRRSARLVAASAVGALGLFSGLAAANALPGAAQGVASDMLSKVGVSVPDANVLTRTFRPERSCQPRMSHRRAASALRSPTSLATRPT